MIVRIDLWTCIHLWKIIKCTTYWLEWLHCLYTERCKDSTRANKINVSVDGSFQSDKMTRECSTDSPNTRLSNNQLRCFRAFQETLHTGIIVEYLAVKREGVCRVDWCFEKIVLGPGRWHSGETSKTSPLESCKQSLSSAVTENCKTSVCVRLPLVGSKLFQAKNTMYNETGRSDSGDVRFRFQSRVVSCGPEASRKFLVKVVVTNRGSD